MSDHRRTPSLLVRCPAPLHFEWSTAARMATDCGLLATWPARPGRVHQLKEARDGNMHYLAASIPAEGATRSDRHRRSVGLLTSDDPAQRNRQRQAQACRIRCSQASVFAHAGMYAPCEADDQDVTRGGPGCTCGSCARPCWKPCPTTTARPPDLGTEAADSSFDEPGARHTTVNETRMLRATEHVNGSGPAARPEHGGGPPAQTSARGLTPCPAQLAGDAKRRT